MPSPAAGSCPLCPRSVALCLPVLAHSWLHGGLVVRRSVAFAWRPCLFAASRTIHLPVELSGLEHLTPTLPGPGKSRDLIAQAPTPGAAAVVRKGTGCTIYGIRWTPPG